MNYRVILTEDKRIMPFQQALIREYEKRLSRYCRIQLHIVRKEKEWDRFLDESRYRIGVVPGRSITSSTDFAEKIRSLSLHGNSSVDFFLAAGTEEALTAFSVHETMSVSRLDFQPAVTAGILYEQLYRAFRIIQGAPYHK